ncbi:hypothetical protein Hanom_Chr00s000003g01603101 [Helianthus anomalus]
MIKIHVNTKNALNIFHKQISKLQTWRPIGQWRRKFEGGFNPYKLPPSLRNIFQMQQCSVRRFDHFLAIEEQGDCKESEEYYTD